MEADTFPSLQFPMKEPVILAIETSGLVGSVALVSEKFCLAECSLQSNITHSRRLLECIDWVMAAAGIDWDCIPAIAISIGPGSFTGLRISLSTAKGLAMAAKKPLIGVSTLDGLAVQFFDQKHLVVPVIDARKKEVYSAFYRCDPKTGEPERISDYLNIAPEILAEKIDEQAILVGDGAQLYEKVFRTILGGRVLLASSSIHFPRAATIGFLALQKAARGEYLDTATAEPLYVRASDAEINLGR
jgi:tRNA threonylcarbamoyladenosine biosynthesis protein TsaB